MSITIWHIKDAPKQYKDLLQAEVKVGQISNDTRKFMKWVAVMSPSSSKERFWGEFDLPAKMKTLARAFRGGVIFHFCDLGDQHVYFFSDNDEDMEMSS